MTLLSAVTVITPFVILGLLFLPSYSAVTWSLIAVWVIGQFFYSTFLGSRLGHSTDLRQYGPWAVVTGSTDGIGKEYAKQLAARGLNLVLISRSPAKLQTTKTEIEKLQPSIQVRTIAVDFTEDRSIYRRIAAELGDLEIGVLINNVGMCENYLEPFIDIAGEHVIDNLINCNIVSVARMTHMLLPAMIQRRRGVIINVGSTAGAISTPLGILYGATKGFVNKFSQDLEYELRGTGVMVQTVIPGYVLTNMVKSTTRLGLFFGVPTAEEYVDAAISSLGIESYTAAYWSHKLQIRCHVVCEFLAPEITKFVVIRGFKILTGKNK